MYSQPNYKKIERDTEREREYPIYVSLKNLPEKKNRNY